MPKEEPLVILGTTTEVLLNARFRVTLPNGQKVLTHITRTIVSDHSDRTPTLVAGCVPTGGEEEKEVPCLVSLRRLPHLEVPACERIPYRAWLRASTTMKTGVLALARRRTKNDCSRLMRANGYLELGSLTPLKPFPLMPNQPAPETELLRAAYAAFNARDIDAALALMTPEVEWPRAFKGGFVRGPEAIRAYWAEQWSEINPHVEPVAFHPEDAGHVLVEAHQIVRDLAGTVVADEHVGHRFTIEHGLIQRMEVNPLPSSGH
jgi:hypothetical protein